MPATEGAPAPWVDANASTRGGGVDGVDGDELGCGLAGGLEPRRWLIEWGAPDSGNTGGARIAGTGAVSWRGRAAGIAMVPEAGPDMTPDEAPADAGMGSAMMR